MKYEFVDNYKNIFPCMLLYFNDNKIMPIKEQYFNEYLNLINSTYTDLNI